VNQAVSDPVLAEPQRVLVAGVGNVLRGDNRWTESVVAALGTLPGQVRLIETGIGGIALLQELMTGFDGLVLIDAVERGATPGTVFLITPEVRDGVHVPDVHLANPDRVLSMAKTMGVLPERVVIVGCQPDDAEGLSEVLSPSVRRAVDVAVGKVREILDAWL
jgi:hydrogenase maturation protease